MSDHGSNPRPLLPEQIGILIPVRLESQRFPGKPLKPLWGRPLVWWPYRAALESRAAGIVRIVTDSPEIAAWCREEALDCYFSQQEYPTGSDRLAGAISAPEAHLGQLQLIIDLQCDEPQITAADLARLVKYMAEHRGVLIATYACPTSTTLNSYFDENCVKVLTDRHENAIYFTRTAVAKGAISVAEHVGIYAYRRRMLESFGRYPQGELEKVERLEQLRLLEEGVPIKVLHLPRRVLAVNSPEDLEWLNTQSSADTLPD